MDKEVYTDIKMFLYKANKNVKDALMISDTLYDELKKRQ